MDFATNPNLPGRFSMDTNRLRQIEDVTRRYAKYRPCGAGLGVLWGGALLALLGVLLVKWTTTAYATLAEPSQSFWRFLRSTQLTPPVWLSAAAVAAPFLAWLGLHAIQYWVDRRFGTVIAADAAVECPRRPRWLLPGFVALLSVLLGAILIWDSGSGFAAGGAAGILAIAAWTLVWGRASRDGLTQFVMFAVSIPSLYVLASTDADSKMAAGNLLIFASYFALMLWLVVQGATRFAAFVRVRRELATLGPVHE
jgi:hypothetical protein